MELSRWTTSLLVADVGSRSSPTVQSVAGPRPVYRVVQVLVITNDEHIHMGPTHAPQQHPGCCLTTYFYQRDAS